MYSLDFSRSFEEKESLQADNNTLMRIKNAYIKAKQDQVNIDSNYLVSREWIPIYNKFMDSTIENLLHGTLNDIQENFSNFFRRPCSTGLHGLHFDMVEKYMNNKPSTEDMKTYMDSVSKYIVLFMQNFKNKHPSVLSRPLVGNPYGYDIVDDKKNKYFIYGGAEYHFYYANKIKMLLNNKKSSKIIEIGGGFGGLASFLLRDFSCNLYAGIDLPENLALQSYFLMTLFPNKRFALYGEFDINDVKNISDYYDVLLLPTHCIESFPENYFNLSYNSYSLAEMSLESSNNYIKWMSLITSEYIYHINHVYWPVSSDNFKIDYEKFDLFLRFPTMWGKDPINPKIDHHDFIYKKIG